MYCCDICSYNILCFKTYIEALVHEGCICNYCMFHCTTVLHVVKKLCAQITFTLFS